MLTPSGPTTYDAPQFATLRANIDESNREAGMSQGLTDWLRQNRFVVVAVDPARRSLRVKSDAEMCTDLACSERTLVVSEEGSAPDLRALNAGDIVKIEETAGHPERIVVVRRVWEELTTPEW